ncbi:hypothetical protein K402DRAFT_451975 [Aulographum hederae CBS 113979]|uniref:Transcription initiation factor TFIID subunit 8 n=1 Tax=Aulographum hederae CBS 113979 TaxID=1176131 RepID=A0A6G1H9U9_9PEZI|nr:hypothetical protein K402DRAFT_451975 [Aulographum hederae CBS 113979]
MSISVGVKRPADSNETEDLSSKRRRLLHHRIKYKQPAQSDPLLAIQDEPFFQAQLLRAIGIGLAAAGFDGAQQTALESFRMHVHEYMLKFLSMVRSSMLSSRRSAAIPHDFIVALANLGIDASSLVPHVAAPIPSAIALPPIRSAPPAELPLPNLEPVLGPKLSAASDRAERKWIPSHFPPLPSKHTYQATDVTMERERDPRKIREQAMKEGILAEQALRKFMGRVSHTLQPAEEMKRKVRKGTENEEMWEELLRTTTQQDEVEKQKFDMEREQELERLADLEFENGNWQTDGTNDLRPSDSFKQANFTQAVKSPLENNMGMLVNYDQKNWIKGPR